MTRRNSPDTLKALVDSLWFDPFYVAISQNVDDEVRRREALARYFDYCMSEGDRRGRLVVWPDPSIGAAVWLFAAASSVSHAESDAKAAFLTEVIGAHGAENYHRIIDFMRPRASAMINESAWYLSIVGVAPSAQGHGIGARLIEPTLADADEAGVNCYLETFDSRNPRFYRRVGFSGVGSPRRAGHFVGLHDHEPEPETALARVIGVGCRQSRLSDRLSRWQQSSWRRPDVVFDSFTLIALAAKSTASQVNGNAFLPTRHSVSSNIGSSYRLESK